jgi:hypothetical protein
LSNSHLDTLSCYGAGLEAGIDVIDSKGGGEREPPLLPCACVYASLHQKGDTVFRSFGKKILSEDEGAIGGDSTSAKGEKILQPDDIILSLSRYT